MTSWRQVCDCQREIMRSSSQLEPPNLYSFFEEPHVVNQEPNDTKIDFLPMMVQSQAYMHAPPFGTSRLFYHSLVTVGAWHKATNSSYLCTACPSSTESAETRACLRNWWLEFYFTEISTVLIELDGSFCWSNYSVLSLGYLGIWACVTIFTLT